LLEKVFDSGVQGNVAVGVQFSDGGSQPAAVADLGDRVTGEPDEFAFAEPGSSKYLHGDPVEQVGQVPRGGEQCCRFGVVEESGQQSVPDRHVAAEDGVPRWGVGVVPFDEAVEHAAQVPQAHPGRRFRGFTFASVAGLAGEKRFEAFDVGAADLCQGGHVGVVLGEVDGEVPQRGVDQFDAARAHADGDLGQVSTQGFDQLRRGDGEACQWPMRVDGDRRADPG